MRDFIWKMRDWLEAAYEWARELLNKILPHDDDSPELRSLKLYALLFVGIIGLMLVIGGITFGIAVRGQPETLVPNLQGRDVLDALGDLQSKELYPDVQVQYSADIDKGTVISQRPAPGTLVKAGQRVTMRVSRGPVIDKVENYVGMSLDDVKVHLQTMFASHSPNIIIKTPIIYQYKPGVPAGRVLAQSPAPNTKITGVASLELVVSQEPGAASTVTVGDYVGKSFQEAVQELVRDNVPFAFSVKPSSKGADAGAVISQVPAKGAQADYGQVVQLTMTAPTSTAVGKDNVFGLFQFTIPPQAIAVDIRLVAITDSEPKELLSMKHPGGPFAVPYIVPDGSDLVLYVLDQEAA
ncbi:MAG TPA: PASTA domain-containing protein, partial [Spirochaetia bacterium]|nr:PASTA domain-containing protein [Spirochaetia bacterium]